jgi:predicted transposase YdaD
MPKKQPITSKNGVKKSVQKPLKKEGNAFDKIMKEIIEKVFRPLVEQRFGIKIVKSTPLKEKMQTTIELEMDFFYEIETETGEIFILHLEFESGDNPEMVYRVGEYHGLALRRSKLPIRHVVIYLGANSPKMRTQLKPEEVYAGFDLLNVNALDTTELLSSQIPEVVLMAVLSNYELSDAERVLRQIVEKLKKIIKNKRVLRKYIIQLMMLSRLRKIEALTIKISEEMPIHIDYETDTLYLRGTEKGLEKGLEKGREEGREEEREKKNAAFVRSLLMNSDFTDDKIALMADVGLDYVQKIKLELNKKMDSNK